MNPKSLLRHLYVQVLLGILLGVIVGREWPEFAVKLKPLGDAFIKLIRMVVAPIIFTTVVVGMTAMGDLKRVGRIGLKAMIYFEVVTTLALVIGWVVIKIIQPGAGINADAATLDTKDVQSYLTAAKSTGAVDFLLNIIPNTIVGAFAQGDILQVLFFSVLFGVAMAGLGEANKPVIYALDQISNALMKMVSMIIRLAPLAAFGAIAFTVGKFGLGSLWSLGKLMACVYLTCACFIVLVLGLLLRLNGMSLWKFLRFIREEIFIVLGTASSEPVLPRMMAKLEALGCAKPLVGLVLPAGYSFNLDGTSIYLTMGVLFIAQATNTHLTFVQELTLLAVCLITSKGSAAVVGGAFITLAATLTSLDTVPVAGLVLVLGVDRLLSEARAVTNLIGNGVATVVISKWEGGFDEKKAERALGGQ
ncbi:MAG: dicarboxylate/amino acid:cation symporter [Verrucomicrobia bacterium]|nr:dicarboxylate/amino acid:cation symporter [Verrucomicrobiota bacterium]